MGSSGCDMVTTGVLSVCPYPMVNSAQRISHITRFIISTGQGAPAIMPVRRLDKSYDLEIRQSQLRDEHGGHAIKRSRPLRLHRLRASPADRMSSWEESSQRRWPAPTWSRSRSRSSDTAAQARRCGRAPCSACPRPASCRCSPGCDASASRPWAGPWFPRCTECWRHRRLDGCTELGRCGQQFIPAIGAEKDRVLQGQLSSLTALRPRICAYSARPSRSHRNKTFMRDFCSVKANSWVR